MAVQEFEPQNDKKFITPGLVKYISSVSYLQINHSLLAHKTVFTAQSPKILEISVRSLKLRQKVIRCSYYLYRSRNYKDFSSITSLHVKNWGRGKINT